MSTSRKFTEAFRQEAVRLAQSSERPRSEIAADLGIGSSTLDRWIARDREKIMNDPTLAPADEDMAAELKRLRRENGILRQERDILKKAAAFFAREGSR